jgi:hypothetical protein
MAIIDRDSVLKLFDITTDKTEQIDFAQPDVWDIIWSSDYSKMFAAMERAKLLMFQGTSLEVV